MSVPVRLAEIRTHAALLKISVTRMDLSSSCLAFRPRMKPRLIQEPAGLVQSGPSHRIPPERGTWWPCRSRNVARSSSTGAASCRP